MNGGIVIKKVTKDQHFVPRSYLKNFGYTIKSKKGDKNFVAFYQFDKSLYKDDIQVKDICYGKYFYGNDGVLEKEFSKKEGVWASILSFIVKETKAIELSDEQIYGLKEFAVYQYLRTSATLLYSQNAINNILSEAALANKLFPDEYVENIKKKVKDKVESELTAEWLIRTLAEELLKEINDLSVSIVKFSTASKLITSDMPVLIFNPFCPSKAGLAYVGVMLVFPVSSDSLVVIYDSKVYPQFKQFMISDNEEDVKCLNNYQILSAEKRIISEKTSDFEGLLNDDMLNKRKTFLEEKSTESLHDGVGILFKMKPRFLRYEYPLVLFKLPRVIRKIPTECREAFHRTFSEKDRINMLVYKYRVPDYIREQKIETKLSPSQLKRGYSQLLEYMDAYWNLSSEDRTITPEMMWKVKTVPLHKLPF